MPPVTAGEISARAERRLKAIGGLIVFLAGCGRTLTPAQQAEVDLYECRLHALMPFLTEARPDIEQMAAALHSCEPVVAPPPAPGDKVL